MACAFVCLCALVLAHVIVFVCAGAGARVSSFWLKVGCLCTLASLHVAGGRWATRVPLMCDMLARGACGEWVVCQHYPQPGLGIRGPL